MENKYKYIAVIKNSCGALKCAVNIFDKPEIILTEHPDKNAKLISEWSKNIEIIDFASNDDIRDCRKFAITKHYESGSKILHGEALSKGIEVDCIEIKQVFSPDLKEVVGYKAYFKKNVSELTSENKQFSNIVLPEASTLENKRFFNIILSEESTDEYVLRRLMEKSGEKLKSRIDILDDLAKRFGKQENIQSFEEFYSFYNFDANVMIIRQAMAEYELQGINDYKSKKSNNNGISNPTHNELIFRDFIRANQLTAKWHEFIKENPLSEPETSAKNYFFTEQEVKDLLIKTLTDLTPKEKEYNNDLFEGDVFKSKDITEAIEFGMKKASNLERLVYLRAISEVQDKIDNAKKIDK
jgi:hypothetical protein